MIFVSEIYSLMSLSEKFTSTSETFELSCIAVNMLYYCV